MCLFHAQKARREYSLLKRAEDFPIPVGEEFPRDVMIGWKYWALTDWAHLRSPTYRTVWEPGKPLVSKRPTNGYGRGIYCFGSEEPAIEKVEDTYRVGMVWGSIALWGVVFNFRESSDPTRQGCVGEFAYPLEIHLPASYPLFASLKFAAAWTPTGTEVFRGEDKL